MIHTRRAGEPGAADRLPAPRIPVGRHGRCLPLGTSHHPAVDTAAPRCGPESRRTSSRSALPEGPPRSPRSPAQPQRPRGHPTDEELAAVAAVLAATVGMRNSLTSQGPSSSPRGARWPELWPGSPSPRSWVTRQGGPAEDRPPRARRV
ncbi:hypothetical protein [Streptomyces sp. NPDC090021]|uniref:hypothetical protein n=1 Tax=Streptomyces sp. NPDC090021 TaxID=3365919 RepID=UPI0037FE2CC6